MRVTDYQRGSGKRRLAKAGSDPERHMPLPGGHGRQNAPGRLARPLARRRQYREPYAYGRAGRTVVHPPGIFLDNVSHELRTPLHGLLSMLQLLDRHPMPPAQREYLKAASASGKALFGIISNILDFSRLESGGMPLETAPFDLAQAARSTFRLFSREAEERGLSLTMDVDPALPPRIVGDAARVRQIIFNLVDNAVKFTEAGSVRLYCSLAPGGAGGADRLLITVADTGIGIPASKLASIFEAFTQADGSSTKKYPGAGLGLSIVQSLTNLMGGTVEVESAVGKGTLVRCRLPLEFPPDAALAGPGQSRLPLPNKGRPMDILVAEDDSVGRFAIMSFLRLAGHRPVCVHNGRQALEALQVHPFNCLFTDIQMPCMDGLELTRRIRQGDTGGFPPSEEVRALLRENLPHINGKSLSPDASIPIVAVSAKDKAGDGREFLRHGIDHYLAKPVVLDQLKTILERIPR